MSSGRSPTSSRGGLYRRVPGVALLRRYQREWLHLDLVAGVVLAAILVPQGMAYAELAGLPAVNGLYTTMGLPASATACSASRAGRVGPRLPPASRADPGVRFSFFGLHR